MAGTLRGAVHSQRSRLPVSAWLAAGAEPVTLQDALPEADLVASSTASAGIVHRRHIFRAAATRQG